MKVSEKTKERANSWSVKGDAYYDNDEWGKAIVCYTKALKMDSNFSDDWNAKGIALWNLNKHDKAIKCYDEALKIQPKNVFALHNKGLTQ